MRRSERRAACGAAQAGACARLNGDSREGPRRVPSQADGRSGSMSESIERLSFELTMSALSEQERSLSSLRSGAATVLGAASIACSFLGARNGSRSLSVWAVLATVAFVMCSASAIWVLVPRSLVLSFGGHRLLDEDDDESRPLAAPEAYRAASGWIGCQLDVNRPAIARLGNWLTASCMLLALEILLTTMSLIG